jgi:N-acetyltransferase
VIDPAAMSTPPRVLATPALEGLEVSLRALREDDTSELAEAASEPGERTGLSPVPHDLASTRAYIAKALAQQASGFRMPFTIRWRGRVVGTTSYSELLPWEWPEGSPHLRTDRPDAVEVGYTWLAPSARRSRVNTEAKFLLFSHAFDTWDVHSVCLRTDLRNERSRRAIERVGATRDGVRRAHMAGADGTVRTSIYFSIVREEWPAVRERLRSLLARG